MDVNWNSIYGIGKGSAQVFQGNPALDDLRKNIALNQQRKAQEEAKFNAGLAKLNFKGAKNADFGELNKQYQDILNTHAQLRNTDNLAQRQQLQQQLQQKQQGLLYDINQSSEHNTQEQKAADLRFNANADLVDDYIPRISALQQMPSIGKGYNGYQNAYQQTMSNIFAPKWDAYKESADLARGLVNVGKPQTVETVDPRTGMVNKAVTAKQTFDKDAFITNYIARAAKSPQAARAAVLATGEQDPADAIYAQANQLADFYSKGLETKYDDKSGGQTIASKIALHNANRQYDQAHPVTVPNTYGIPTPAPQVVPITFKNKNPDGSPMTTTLSDYRAVSIPKATVIPTKGIDDKGNQVNVPAGEYRVIGYATMPTMKKGGGVVQSDAASKYPDQVQNKPIAHIQVDVKGRTHNFYVDPNSINVNNTGQKNQQKAVNKVTQNNPLGLDL